jgi:hypothetical protein
VELNGANGGSGVSIEWEADVDHASITLTASDEDTPSGSRGVGLKAHRVLADALALEADGLRLAHPAGWADGIAGWSACVPGSSTLGVLARTALGLAPARPTGESDPALALLALSAGGCWAEETHTAGAERLSPASVLGLGPMGAPLLMGAAAGLEGEGRSAEAGRLRLLAAGATSHPSASGDLDAATWLALRAATPPLVELPDPPSAPPPEAHPALRAWWAFLRGDADRGALLLREAYDHQRADVTEPEGLALIPCAVLFGVLGARGDAQYGRLHLSPRWPAGWHDVEVRGVPLGPVRADVSFHAEARERTLRVTPVAGGLPPSVVLNGRVTFAPLAVTVDGQEAEVELEPEDSEGRTWAVRLQFPLDGPREIRIIGREGGGS